MVGGCELRRYWCMLTKECSEKMIVGVCEPKGVNEEEIVGVCELRSGWCMWTNGCKLNMNK